LSCDVVTGVVFNEMKVMSNDICKLHMTAFHQVLQGNSSMFYSVKVAVDFEE
jgi:Zn-dependent M16 (insulinase) family peptidase